mmetsp:Transcript_37074/g.47269  ORF Transcript_37074/g.47269 Transcript_37074/m.47269 type:complete len:136 (+) Transcript_37074:1433-1840(+)
MNPSDMTQYTISGFIRAISFKMNIDIIHIAKILLKAQETADKQKEQENNDKKKRKLEAERKPTEEIISDKVEQTVNKKLNELKNCGKGKSKAISAPKTKATDKSSNPTVHKPNPRSPAKKSHSNQARKQDNRKKK